KGLLVDGHNGVKVPLSQVAEVGFENRPYFINRERVQRRIVVQANVAGRDLGSLIAEAQQKIASQVNLPSGYFVEYGGQFGSQQEATRILLSYGGIAIVVIFLLLYKAFNSARASFLVLANLPLALIGGVLAIYLTGGIMSIPSLIGLISVFGIAARNGIILVTHYHTLRVEGLSRDQVVLQGSKDRLAPVLMTAAAAALGLLPLLFGDIAGKELERPLAHVILGGLFTSTVLNMIIVPVLYSKYGWEKEEVFVRQLAIERGELLGGTER
ncbi:MAG: CusA/CzcA family heavy metal efflux RND transporter, partial [Verrucomicrobia bacterium]